MDSDIEGGRSDGLEADVDVDGDGDGDGGIDGYEELDESHSSLAPTPMPLSVRIATALGPSTPGAGPRSGNVLLAGGADDARGAVPVPGSGGGGASPNLAIAGLDASGVCMGALFLDWRGPRPGCPARLAELGGVR